MPDAYCTYHTKPLEDVSEHEQASCWDEGWNCQECPYLGELMPERSEEDTSEAAALYLAISPEADGIPGKVRVSLGFPLAPGVSYEELCAAVDKSILAGLLLGHIRPEDITFITKSEYEEDRADG